MARRFFIPLIALILIGCAPTAPAPTPTPAPTATATPDPVLLCAGFIAEFDPIIAHFYDAAAIADSTARVSLDGPVAELQSVRRELEAIGEDLPPCASPVYDPALAYMNAVIESMLMFMRDEPRAAITAELEQAADLRREFTGQRNLISQELLVATRQATVP